jgi:cysteinyl-tRNA synthetase
VREDLDTPVGLAVTWELVKDPSVPPARKLELLLDFDRVLGLGVDGFRRTEVGPEELAMIERRERARRRGDWGEADALRARLREAGIEVRDSPDGPQWFPIPAGTARDSDAG